MGEATEIPAIGTPSRWLIIFNREAAGRWQSLVAMGRYKHVRAMGYVPGVRHWLCYDVTFRGTQIVVVRDGSDEFRAMFDDWTADADILWMDARPAGRARFPPVFLCTTSIKHLLGLRCSALRPDALYRHCLANGAEPLDERAEEARTAADEPAVRSAAAAGGAG